MQSDRQGRGHESECNEARQKFLYLYVRVEPGHTHLAGSHISEKIVPVYVRTKRRASELDV